MLSRWARLVSHNTVSHLMIRVETKCPNTNNTTSNDNIGAINTRKNPCNLVNCPDATSRSPGEACFFYSVVYKIGIERLELMGQHLVV